jgi:Secretion system C-terminal sorting domain/von Willebrand factor type A domain
MTSPLKAVISVCILSSALCVAFVQKQSIDIYRLPHNAADTTDTTIEIPVDTLVVLPAQMDSIQIWTVSSGCTTSNFMINACSAPASVYTISTSSYIEHACMDKSVKFIGSSETPSIATWEGATEDSESLTREEYIGEKNQEAIGGSGILTAGEINDFTKWEMWKDLSEGELDFYKKQWSLDLHQRYCVIVRNNSGNAVIDATVKLKGKDGVLLWSARTDNTGKAELWGSMAVETQGSTATTIEVSAQGTTQTIRHPKVFEKGINTIELPVACSIPNGVDIAFVVDATGSMGDEISYLQAELVDVVEKVKAKYKDINLRLGSVFYRDYEEEYVTRSSILSNVVSKTNTFINQQAADGGGDTPEAVEAGLEAALTKLQWATSARSRIAFLILDAAPHEDEAIVVRMHKAVKDAARMGIRLVPIVASGESYEADKSLEYLMRCAALMTNGTYSFLTDDSGVGNAHTAPSTDTYEVETLNHLMVRLIEQFVDVSPCVDVMPELTAVPDTITISDSLQLTALPADSLPARDFQLTFSYYPNPTVDFITVETTVQVQTIYIGDMYGKLLTKTIATDRKTQIYLGDLPSGTYMVYAVMDDKWLSGKVVVMHI